MTQKAVTLCGADFNQSSYYEIDRRKLQETAAPVETFGVEEANLLLAGVAVVLPDYLSAVRSASRHDVYRDKTIVPTRSAHEVAFGRLMGHNSNVQRETARFGVAMKPFNRPQDALHEVYGYMLLNQLGVQTFQPIGVFPAKKGSHYIALSEDRKDLMSLDRDEWVVGRNVENVDQAETAARNNKTVTEIAQTLAYLHSNGVFHPDGQIKNFAITYDGKVGVIDTENLRYTSTDNFSNPISAWGDIEKLVHSLVVPNGESDKIFGVGMLSNMPFGEVRRSVQELVVDPYISATLDWAGESGSEAALRMAMYVQEQFDGAPNWPDHLISK